jgi:hypothetical protein
MDDKTQENLITMLGLEYLPIGERAKVVEEVSQIVEMRVLSRVFDDLGEDTKEAYDKVLETKDPEQVMIFLQDNIPNINQYFSDEIARIREELQQKKAEFEQTLEKDLNDQLVS